MSIVLHLVLGIQNSREQTLNTHVKTMLLAQLTAIRRLAQRFKSSSQDSTAEQSIFVSMFYVCWIILKAKFKTNLSFFALTIEVLLQLHWHFTSTVWGRQVMVDKSILLYKAHRLELTIPIELSKLFCKVLTTTLPISQVTIRLVVLNRRLFS
jgi:hypothetical protein